MSRLKNLNQQQVKKKMEEFPQPYANNWKHWLAVKKMKGCLNIQPQSRFFLATDEPAVESKLKEIFPDKIITFSKCLYSKKNLRITLIFGVWAKKDCPVQMLQRVWKPLPRLKRILNE